MTELIERSGLRRTTLTFHLRVLERARSISCHRMARRTVVQLAGRRRDDTVLPALPPGWRKLLALIDIHGVVNRADLAAQTPELPRRTRDHAIARLTGLGIVVQREDGQLARACHHEVG